MDTYVVTYNYGRRRVIYEKFLTLKEARETIKWMHKKTKQGDTIYKNPRIKKIL